MEIREQYMTAREAAETLEISRATLYAYVSRGLIRSEPVSGQSRRHRYLAADVHHLRERKAQRRNPALAAQHALHFGVPILESRLTLIDGSRLYYRGQDALHLARSRTVEEVAYFLWNGSWGKVTIDQLQPIYSASCEEEGELTMLERFQRALPTAAARDLGAYDLQPPAVRATGGRILGLITEIAALRRLKDDIVSTLLDGWRVTQAGADRLLAACLILCADHELNVSSFTARCVASAGSTPYQVVQAGLAALQGVRHGGHTARVAALFAEVGEPQRAREVLGERLRRGETLPGFGHPLYPDGDPRAQLLLQMCLDHDSQQTELSNAIVRQAARLIGQPPTIDFALVTVERLLALPRGASLGMFALGRTIGWIAHALEQYSIEKIIRPRARYVGPLPGTTGEGTVVP